MHPNDRNVKKPNSFDDSKITSLYPSSPRPELVIEIINDVKEVKIDWLWKDKLAFGKITLFAGEPGVGKSQLLLYIASVVSNGNKFHFEINNVNESKVLLISGEDNTDDTIKPRLMALGADLNNIHNVKGLKKIDANGNEYHDAICLIDNIQEIEAKIKEHKYKLIIVDPISVYLGSIDENKNKEIRSALNVLSSLAERHKIAIVLNSHFSKPSGNGNKNAINRIMGSLGFAAAARIVFGIMKDPENPDRRLFVPIKNNIGDDKIGYVYNIEPVAINGYIETSRIKWIDEKVTKTANDILNPSAQIAAPKLDEAKQILAEMLKDGSKSVSEIREKFNQSKISIDRMYKAKNELKIIEDVSFMGKRGKIWYLAP